MSINSINSTNKHKLRQWFSNIHKKNNKKVLLVYGQSGLGKFTSVNEILNEFQYDVHTFHSIDFMNKKDIRLEIKKMVNNRSIFMMMNKEKCKNAIIIKELEALNKPHNLKFIIEVINNYFTDKNTNAIPLVCIASGDFFKKMGDLEKLADKIKFKKPSVTLFKKHITELFKRNNLLVETKLKNYMAKNIDCNFRKLNNIFDYMLHNPEPKFKLNDYKDIVDMIAENENNEIELYDMVLRIMNDKDLTISMMTDFFNVEKIFLPLMIHQNFKMKLFYSNKNKLEDYIKIMNVISQSDIIHKYIFDYHYWNLQNAYSILSCYYPYFIIKKSRKTLKLEDIKFTSILNKNSFKYATHLNCNKIMRASKQLFNFDDMLLIYYCRNIAFYLLSDNVMTQEKGLKLLLKNNFVISDISKIIKFSNFTEYDSKYNKKIYNKLKKLYNNMIKN